MDYTNVLYDAGEHIATITLNRPEKLNAISDSLRTDLEGALREAEADHEVRVIIIKGAGRSFCSGYDISPRGPEDARRQERTLATDRAGLIRSAQRWMWMWSLPKPIIAQVHGYCIAGGNEIAGMCDIIYAADDATFGQPQGRALGIAITMGLWPIKMPLSKAKELLFTGDSITGKEAEDLGLVTRSFPADKLDEEVRRIVARMALTPVEYLGVIKGAANRYYELMNIKGAVEQGGELDAIYHAMPGYEEFSRISREQGLKAALDWRDRPFRDYRGAS